MLTPIPDRFLCNNCASTKEGSVCIDCIGNGCNCSCQNRKGIRRHEKTLHPVSCRLVTCPVCGKVREVQHVKLVHGITFREARK